MEIVICQIPVHAMLAGLVQIVRCQFVRKLVVMAVIVQIQILVLVLPNGKELIAVHQRVLRRV
jgi:hypothetical protein